MSRQTGKEEDKKSEKNKNRKQNEIVSIYT